MLYKLTILHVVRTLEEKNRKKYIEQGLRWQCKSREKTQARNRSDDKSKPYSHSYEEDRVREMDTFRSDVDEGRKKEKKEKWKYWEKIGAHRVQLKRHEL